MSRYQQRQLLKFSRNGDVRRLNTLLDEGVDCNFLDGKTGMTPLMTAAFAGHVTLVESLLRAGASLDLYANDGASALFWASVNGHSEIVTKLLDAGADPNVRRDNGPTPLHVALGNSHDDIAIELIKRGAFLDWDYLGRSVIEYAEKNGRDVVVKYLRELLKHRSGNRHDS